MVTVIEEDRQDNVKIGDQLKDGRGRGRGGRGRRANSNRGVRPSAPNSEGQNRLWQPRGGKAGRGAQFRGGRQPTSSPGDRRRHNTNHKRRLFVFTSDFGAFHKECQAARYKVHKPHCKCPKIHSITKNCTIKLQGETDVELEAQDPSNRSRVLDSTNLVSNHEEGSKMSCFDGLLVVPEINKIPALFLCPGTREEDVNENLIETELKLKRRIFADHSVTPKVSTQVFKISCAFCLLEKEPNGFACVSSSSPEIVNAVRDAARDKTELCKDNLHADHAHHCVSLPQSILRQHLGSRTRQQVQHTADVILEHMREQGVDVHKTENPHVKLDHHLKFLLWLTKEDTKQQDQWWLVMVFDDTKSSESPRWTLDLPGGKRHLGETALEGAIRETNEEISLEWTKEWVQGIKQSQKSSDVGNRMFLLAPPASFVANRLG